MRRLLPLLVLVAVALPYLTGLDNGFVWLDHSEIVDGTLLVRDLGEVPGLFLEDRTTPGYHRPLYSLLHSASFAAFGLEPGGFYAVSLALHLANCALVFALLVRHGRSRVVAASVALLFGLHPVNTAVAGLIHSTMDEVYLLGTLAAWLLFARAETGERGAPARGGLWALSILALLAGLYAKENAFLYPAVVLLAAFVPWSFAGGVRPPRRRLLAYAAATGAVTGGVLMSRLSETLATEPLVLGGALGLGERVLTFAGVYVDYVRKLLVPLELSICDTVTRFSALDGAAQLHRLGSFAILAALELAAFAKVPRLRPWILLLNVSLLPVAQVFPILHFRADRFLYGSTLAVAGLLVEGVSLLAERKLGAARASRVLGCVAVGIALAYAARVVPRLTEFRDDRVLFEGELARTPDYREGLSQLGRWYERNGEFEAAGELYLRALAPYPGRVSYVDVHGLTLAFSKNLLARGRVEEAYELARAEHGKSYRPRVREELEYNLAVAAHRLGRHEEALPIFERYAASHPEDASCRYLLGRTAQALDLREEARSSFTRYLELVPDAPDRAEVEGYLRELGGR